MKINKIEIYGFGKWNNVVFDLKQDLQVFYGLNEAGKSTLRQFIYSVLFGFAAGRGNNKYLQYIPKKAKGSAGYGGVLTVQNGDQEYAIERVKGKNGGKVTITNIANGEGMPDDFLSEILGPIDQTTYQHLLGFNQSDLDDFNDLGNRDDLRRHILRMGAVGSDEWIQLENDLKKESNKMYTKSSRTRELNQKITAYKEALQQFQSDKAKLPDYQSAKSIEESSVEELKQIRTAIADLNGKITETNHLLDAWPIYAETLELKGKLKDVPKAYLALDLNRLEILTNKINDLNTNVTAFEKEIDGLPEKEHSIQNAEQLTELQSKLPEAKLNYGQLEDLNKRIARLTEQVQAIENQYEVELKHLNPLSEVDFDQVKNNQVQQKRVNAEITQIKNQMLEKTGSKLPKPASNSTVILGLVAVLTIVDLLLPLHWGIKLVALAVILGAGFLVNRSKVESTEPTDDLSSALIQQEEKLHQLELDLATLGSRTGFESFPTEDWTALQTNLLNYQHLQHEIQDLKEHLKKVNTDIENFWTFSNQIIPMDEANRTVLDQLVEHTKSLLAQNQKEREHQQRRAMLVKDLKVRQAELEELQKDFEQYQVPELNAEFPKWMEEIRAAQQLHFRLQTLEESQQVPYFAQLTKYESMDVLKQISQQQKDKLAELKQTEQDVLDQRADQIGELTGLKNSVDILEEQQKLSEQATEIKEMVAKWLTLRLGAEWVDQTLGVATKGRLPLILEQANAYFAQITNQRYQKMIFDKNDMISVMNQQGQTFEIGELSKGTMEQLYISIRFAFMQAFADAVNLPIIIDDAFVAFDDERLKQVFELLNQITEQTQVIYFSAKKEVYDLVDHQQVTNLNEQ